MDNFIKIVSKKRASIITMYFPQQHRTFISIHDFFDRVDNLDAPFTIIFSVKGSPTAPHITRRTFPHLALQIIFGYLLQTFAVKYCCHSSSRYAKTYRTSWSTSSGNSSAFGRWSISSTLKLSVWNWNSNLSRRTDAIVCIVPVTSCENLFRRFSACS